MSYHRNPDDRIRRLERAAASGDPEATAELHMLTARTTDRRQAESVPAGPYSPIGVMHGPGPVWPSIWRGSRPNRVFVTSLYGVGITPYTHPYRLSITNITGDQRRTPPMWHDVFYLPPRLPSKKQGQLVIVSRQWKKVYEARDILSAPTDPRFREEPVIEEAFRLFREEYRRGAPKFGDTTGGTMWGEHGPFFSKGEVAQYVFYAKSGNRDARHLRLFDEETLAPDPGESTGPLFGPQRNPDDRIRQLERAAAAGDPDAYAELERVLARSLGGDIEVLRVAALFGSPMAQRIVERHGVVNRQSWDTGVFKHSAPNAESIMANWSWHVASDFEWNDNVYTLMVFYGQRRTALWFPRDANEVFALNEANKDIVEGAIRQASIMQETESSLHWLDRLFALAHLRTLKELPGADYMRRYRPGKAVGYSSTYRLVAMRHFTGGVAHGQEWDYDRALPAERGWTDAQNLDLIIRRSLIGTAL